VEARVSQRQVLAIALDTGELACRRVRSFARHRTITALDHGRALRDLHGAPAEPAGRAAAARALRRPHPRMKTSSEPSLLFRTLKAPAAARALPKLAERARHEAWSYERFCEALLATEVASRDAHGGETRIKQARLPARKTLEELDFGFQRSVQKTLVLHPGQLDFLTANENVLPLGPPAPGSHCPPRRRHCANSPASVPDTRMRRPLRRPVVTWTASSSPRWTLCKTVWRATPSRWAASASGRNPAGTSGTNRRRTSAVSRIRQGAPAAVCSPGSSPARSQR
jgi:IstB-like ATP binding protein